MGDAIINIIVLFINLVDTVVVNWWTQAPQGGRVLALFLFIGAVYLMGELKGEENAWLDHAREMLIVQNYDDPLYVWACTLNSLAQRGKISYRMEYAKLYPLKQ